MSHYDDLLAEAKAQIQALFAQVDLKATGATIHDLRIAKAELAFVFRNLDLAVNANAESSRIYLLQKHLELRVRVLRRLLAGERGHSRIYQEERRRN